MGDADVTADVDDAGVGLHIAVADGEIAARVGRASGLGEVDEGHGAGAGEGAATLREAGRRRGTRVVERTAGDGEVIQRHAARGDVQGTAGHGQRTRGTEAIDGHRTEHGGSDRRTGEGDVDAGREDDVRDVGEIGHRPTRPVGRVEPVAVTRPTRPRDGSQASDLRRGRGIEQAVVAGLSAGQRAHRDIHGLGGRHVLIDETTGKRSEAHGVTGDDAGEGARDGGGRGAVVDLIGRGEATERERQRRDVRGHARRLDEQVIGRVGTDDGVTRDHDRLAVRHIGVGEKTGGARHDERRVVAQERIDNAAREGRRPRAVVDLMQGRDARDREGRDGDVGLDVRRLDETVVRRICPGQGEAEEADHLTATDVLVGERGRDARAIHADGIVGEAGDDAAGEGSGVGAIVVLILGGDARDRPGERRHRQRADHGRGTAEVATTHCERSRGRAIVTDAQVAADAVHRIGRTECEVHRAASTVRVLEGVTRAPDGRQAGEYLTAVGQVFDAGDIERRGRSVGGRPVGGAYEELAGRDDGVIARDIVHRVILCAQAAGLEYAGVDARGLRARVGTGDRQTATHDRGGIRADEAGEADAVVVGGVGRGDELGVGVSQDVQRGLGDGRGETDGRLERVIGRTDPGQGVTGDGDGLANGRIGVGEGGQGRADHDRRVAGAGDRGDDGGPAQGRPTGGVVDTVDGGDAGDDDGKRRDPGGRGLSWGEDVIARTPGAIRELDGGDGDEVGLGDVLGVEGGHEGGAQRLPAHQALQGQRTGRGGRTVIGLIRRDQGGGQRLRGDGQRPGDEA